MPAGLHHVVGRAVTTDPAAADDGVVRPPEGADRFRLVLILGALIALGPLTIDMYLPALPEITADLLTTEAAVQLTLTGTLLGLAAGQLVIGPFADAFGRKRPLLIAAAVYVVASVLCAVAPTIGVLAGLRVLQGMGAAAGIVVALAVIRDLYVGRPAAILLSRLILVMGAAPIIAPTLGGALLGFTSWRGVFVALAVYGLVLIPIAFRFLPETLPRRRRRPARIVPTVRKYGELLRDRVFVGLVLTAGLMMSAMFAYIAGSSFVFQQQFGFDEQSFGLLFGAGAFAIIGASQLNAYLLRWFEPRQLLLSAVLAGTIAALVLVAAASTGFGGLIGVLVPLWTTLAAIGVALPNSPALALTRHGEAAGTAAALLGAVQFGIGAVVSPLVGVVGNTAAGMGLVIATAIAAALLVLTLVVRPWQLGSADATDIADARAAEAAG